MEKSIIIVLLLLLPHFSVAQVPNDHIENRIELLIDERAFSSNTTDCTVQWNCVDQSLTGKCIQYHNDQWFYFTTQDTTNYYINISGQQCRDLRGVQVVVIDGTPCDPTTYQILNCTSLSTQDDIFVSLDSLKPYHTYLLNVDGYLNDHCRFAIQVSTTPQGLPLRPAEESVEINSHKEGNKIILDWAITKSLGNRLIKYEIFRRHTSEKKFGLSKKVIHEKNAFGISTLTYSVIDTVSVYGTYQYKIAGITQKNERLLLGTRAVTIRSPLPTLVNNYLTLSIPCTSEEVITVSIYNVQTQKLLKTEEIQCTTGDYIWKYNILSHFHSDIQFYKITIQKPGEKVKEFLYHKE